MSKDPKDEKKSYFMVSSLERGLRMIELLAEKEVLTVSESARLMGLNRSAAHRFLATLHALGYVTRDNRSRYRLSLKLFELGNRVANHTEIRAIVRPLMRDLAETYHETVNLGRMENQDVVTIDVVLGTEVLKFDSPIGSRSPAHTLAMGKAILAFSDFRIQQAYLDSARFDPLTPNTITDPSAFMAELDMIRRQGYALDNEEWAPGLRCVAAPIFDHANEPAYAISISGPIHRMTDAAIADMRRDLIRYCRMISKRLGGSHG